jgi:hypothetical protein
VWTVMDWIAISLLGIGVVVRVLVLVPDRIRGILSSTRGRLTCFFTCSPTLIILEYV